MSTYIEEPENFWDWVSIQVQQDYDDKEDFATLVKQSLDFLNPYLDRMIWVEANIIYLNKVYDISQTLVGDYLGISQFGVSKRARKGMERLKVKIKCPEQDYAKVRDDLVLVFGEDNVGIAMSLYVFNTLSMTQQLYSHHTKDYIVDTIEAFISAKDIPIESAIKAHGLGGFNIAKLKRLPEYHAILANEQEIVEVSQKYGEYFRLILDTTGVGELVFNKQNRNRNWFD